MNSLNNIDPREFRLWQIDHYRQRLAEDKRPEAKAFLRDELKRLEKQNTNP